MATKKTADVAGDIRAANKALAKVFASGDAAGVAAKYTKGAILMPPNAGPTKGHKKIAAFWAGAIGMGVKSVSLRTTEVEAHGTTAIECGAYALKGENRATLDVGKYIVVWKREGGQWKLHRDIFNTNNPAA